MSRFLRRGALAAAALAGTAAAAVALSDGKQRWGISGNLSRPHDGADADAAAAATHGHLGLVRAHPELRELNEALPASSRDALFLDAAHALTASALRVQTITGSDIRKICEWMVAAESRVDLDPDKLACYRVQRPILEARDGRFNEALSDLARLAGDSPDDHRPRVAAAALCFLHGRSGTATEWLKNIPGMANYISFVETLVAAMPGSSPQSGEEDHDPLVMIDASVYLEFSLYEKMKKGKWSMLEKFQIWVLLKLLVSFLSKHYDDTIDDYWRATRPDYFGTKSSAPECSHPNVMDFTLDMAIVESIQAILSAVLRARPICGERLRELRSVAEQALAHAEAESDTSAVIDINIFLAFLEIRDGRFMEAFLRYEAAILRDPSDCRPPTLIAKLCAIAGRTEDRDLWLQAARRYGVSVGRHAEQLPALLNEVAIANALGNGGDMASLDPARSIIVIAAWREVDVGLTAALRDGELTFWERVQLRGLRRLLRAKMRPLLMDMAKQGPRDSVVHH